MIDVIVKRVFLLVDTKEFGIPTEKYGFSNNAKGRMGPPSFEQAKFELKNDRVIRITAE
ncbi:DUF2141 domain-containing protein [uncultured Bacteroides sp.]|uniref:DUF2141 domain-containing protein n=1 Tax=uncultured Bacteroides sp. TaxID=162156 RepID=UPI003748C724